MLRATVWTVGLFGAGTALSRLFPGTWTEPLVLLGLGIALLFVSARTTRGTTTTRTRAARPGAIAAKVGSPVGAPAPGAAAVAAVAVQRAAVQAAVQVERTA